MYRNILSIIIPTRNRQVYACKTIETILDLNRNDFEIIVQDNSDDDSLKSMLDKYSSDSRLRYFYDSGCLSFCANFEKSVTNSSGDYLVMIGDDDCILPEILDLVDIMRGKGIEATVFPTCYSYYWPNSIHGKSGELVIRKQYGKLKKLSSVSAIEDMKNVGNYDYQQYNFPKIYHGVVSRKSLDKVKNKTGVYFGGLTPDIYSAVSLAFYIKDYLYVGLPFTLPGVCARSGSADSLTGKHTGDLAKAPHFRGHDHYEWEEIIPYVYSVDTIWAETAVKAIRENGASFDFSDKQLFRFFCYIILNNPVFKDEMISLYADRTSRKSQPLRFAWYVSYLKCRRFVKKGFNFGIQCLKGRYTYEGVEDIQKALELISKKIPSYDKVLNKLKEMDF